jgi:2'-5' RNA ligase
MPHRLLAAALTAESHSLASVPLRFRSVRVFENPGPVVYLAPEDDDGELAALHARLHALAAPHVSDPLPFTRPTEWTPHCTVAWRLSDARLVLIPRRIAEQWLPPAGEGVALGLVDTPAEIELGRIPLSSRVR